MNMVKKIFRAVAFMRLIADTATAEKKFRIEQTDDASITLSPGGSRIAVAYRKGATWSINLNGRVIAGIDGDRIPDLRFSPDGKSYLFLYRKKAAGYIERNGKTYGGYWGAIVNDKTYGPFEAVFTPAFTENGAHFGFWFMQGGIYKLNVDGKVVAESDSLAGYYGEAAPFFRSPQTFPAESRSPTPTRAGKNTITTPTATGSA